MNPEGKDMTEITDSKGFRYPIERVMREFSKIKGFMGFLYLDCPRILLQ